MEPGVYRTLAPASQHPTSGRYFEVIPRKHRVWQIVEWALHDDGSRPSGVPSSRGLTPRRAHSVPHHWALPFITKRITPELLLAIATVIETLIK